jgi:hypothetical protein
MALRSSRGWLFGSGAVALIGFGAFDFDAS